MASYYAFDPDQRQCHEGGCENPVRPIPGLPQCVANPLHPPKSQITTGHQMNKPPPVAPVVSSGPKSWGRESKPANVLVPALLVAALLASEGVPLGRAMGLVLGFAVVYHSMRVVFVSYY